MYPSSNNNYKYLLRFFDLYEKLYHWPCIEYYHNDILKLKKSSNVNCYSPLKKNNNPFPK